MKNNKKNKIIKKQKQKTRKTCKTRVMQFALKPTFTNLTKIKMNFYYYLKRL